MPAQLPQGRAYGTILHNVPPLPGDFWIESAQDLITAFAGGGQANATQITTQTARIGTVATAGDSVQLPPAAPGVELMVINHGAKDMQVFGNLTDTIDDNTFSVGVSQMANSLVIYTCTSSGSWYTEGLATGFAKTQGLQTLKSVQIAASATDTQGGGTPITALVNTVTSSGANQAVTLPLSVAGLSIIVASVTAANVLDVFPAVGDAINALGANTKITMAAVTSATFVCTVAGQWWTVPRVPS